MTAAVLDACVLYPAALRDLWMHLAVRFVFQPKWTARIQEEWIRNVLADRPDLKPEQLARTRALMETWGRDWEVPEYEGVLPTLSLPDPDDSHVLAAAIAGEAPVIVTFNLSHFPDAALAPHGLRAVHPDVFACELLDAEPEAFLLAVRAHRAALKNPPKPVEAYLETLRRAGLARTAARLEAYQDQL
jgi:PIN domain